MPKLKKPANLTPAERELAALEDALAGEEPLTTTLLRLARLCAADANDALDT